MMQLQAPTTTSNARHATSRNVINLADKRNDTGSPTGNHHRSEGRTENPESIARNILKDIEISAATEVSGNAKRAFLAAALRSATKPQSTHGLHLKNIINASGYSRATFFRVFESNNAFRAECYMVFSALAVSTLERHLKGKERTAEDFAIFASSAISGIYHSLIKPFHGQIEGTTDAIGKSAPDVPHHLSHVISDYLRTNPRTRHLQISKTEIRICLRAIEIELLGPPHEWQPETQARSHRAITKAIYGLILASDPGIFPNANTV